MAVDAEGGGDRLLLEPPDDELTALVEQLGVKDQLQEVWWSAVEAAEVANALMAHARTGQVPDDEARSRFLVSMASVTSATGVVMAAIAAAGSQASSAASGGGFAVLGGALPATSKALSRALAWVTKTLLAVMTWVAGGVQVKDYTFEVSSGFPPTVTLGVTW